MQKKLYMTLMSFLWLLLYLSICQRSESDFQIKQKSCLISAFWKRGKGIDIDLNSLPPVEGVPGSPDQHNDDVVLSTNPVLPTMTASIDSKEAQRKERKRLYSQRRRKEQKALWNEAKQDQSKLTTDLQREMDRQHAMQRKRQKRYYTTLAKKAKENNFASEIQQINWQRMSHNAGWRKNSSKDEELYQRHTGRIRDWKRRKAAKKQASKKSSLRKRALRSDSDDPFQKRANGLQLDLNSSPPKEDDGQDHDSMAKNTTQDSLRIAPTIKKAGGRPKAYTAAELRARKNLYQSRKRREQTKRFQEAKRDPTKLTPELKKEMDHHYAYQRTRQRDYHQKIAKLVENGEEITPQQLRAFHRKHTTVIWRTASPLNEEKYQRDLKRERERQRDRKKVMIGKNNNNEGSVIFKRALDSDVDLNKSPPSEEEEVTKEESHKANQGKAQVAKGKPSQRKRKSLTAEEKKELGRISSRNFRARRKARFAEAQSDASKMTLKVKEEIERYYRIARKGSNKYYHSIQDKVKANAGISPTQLKVFHMQHKSKAWRNASAKNEAAYQRHLEHNRKKRQKKKDDEARNSESKMQKRGISFDSISEHMNDDVFRHDTTPSTFIKSSDPTPSTGQGAETKNTSALQIPKRLRNKRKKEADVRSPSGSPLKKRGFGIDVDLNRSLPREEDTTDGLVDDIQKRGLDVDLNELPPESEQNVEPMMVQHAEGANEQMSSGKKKRKRKQLTPEEKKRKNLMSAEARRQRKAKWREAMKDPTTVTPEIQSAYERHQASVRRIASRAYHTLRQKVKEGKSLTPYEIKRNQYITRSKEWRENPANRKQYEKRLEADRNSKRTKRQSQKAQDKGQKSEGLHTRALEADIDLNKSPPPTHVAEDSHVQPKQKHPAKTRFHQKKEKR